MSDQQPPTSRRAAREAREAEAAAAAAATRQMPAAMQPGAAEPVGQDPATRQPVVQPPFGVQDASQGGVWKLGPLRPTSSQAGSGERAAATQVPAAPTPTVQQPLPGQQLPAQPTAQSTPQPGWGQPTTVLPPVLPPVQPAGPQPDPGDDEPIDRTRRLRVGIIIGASALAFILLCTGSVFLGISAGKNSATAAPQAQSKTEKRAVPGNEVQPTEIPTCSLDSLASNAALIKLYGSVVETATGSPIYSLNDTTGVRPSSVIKVLTAASALSALGPTYQITTSVDETSTPGTITLIGQGDATLSAVAAGHSVYAGAPTLSNLATKALAAYNANSENAGVPISNIILDSTYWAPSDNWDSSVPTTLRAQGYLSETTALQVDGDRSNPAQQISPRSNDPITAAGNAFVQALQTAGADLNGPTITEGATPSGSTQLASVQSQPVSTLVKQMLRQNDDTLAEMLARIISVKENLGGTSASIQQAMTTALAKYNVDTSQLTIEDGSGESDESQIPPQFMSKFMSMVAQQTNGLQYVAAGLPVAGKSGNLAGRFTGASATVSGKITGIAGDQSDAVTLSGYLTAADGTGESFTFFAEGDGITSKANAVLDSLAAAVYQCGKNITSN